MRRSILKSDYAALGILLILLGVLFTRCFFSFCQTDESFYAALANRFWIGEKPVCDEWSRGQFYVPLFLPFYGVYRILRGTTAGVILYLRVLYLGFSFFTALKLFFLVRRETKSRICALAIAAVILLFSRANISGVSYYNLCMLCGISGFCSSVCAMSKVGAHRRIQLIWAGILFASSVLCNPYLAPVFLLVAMCTLTMKKCRRDACSVILGIGILAVLFCIWLLFSAGLSGVIRNIHHIMENTEQRSVSENLCSAVIHMGMLLKFVAIPALLMTALCFIKGKRTDTVDHCFPGYLLAQTVLLTITSLRTIHGICGVVLLPLTVIAFPTAVRAVRQKQDLEAVILYVLGLLFAGTYAIASNTGEDASVVGFCISGAASIWLCWNMLAHSRRTHYRPAAVIIPAVIVLLTSMFCQRMLGVYRDAPLSKLDTRLTQGPGKGLYTTSEHAEQYEAICDALSTFSENTSEGKILYTKNLPWAYLMTECGYATSSPWRTYTEDLEIYYDVHPENRPDYICILAKTVGSWEKSPFNRNPENAAPNEFAYEGEFWEKVLGSPIVVETKELCIYDVRESIKEAELFSCGSRTKVWDR